MLGGHSDGEITGEMHRNVKNVALSHLRKGRLFTAEIRRERYRKECREAVAALQILTSDELQATSDLTN